MNCVECGNPIEFTEDGFCHAHVGPMHYDCITQEFAKRKPDPKKAGLMCGEGGDPFNWGTWLREQRAIEAAL